MLPPMHRSLRLQVGQSCMLGGSWSPPAAALIALTLIPTSPSSQTVLPFSHSCSCAQANEISYEDAKELHWFAVFYRTGSVIFGGGQVRLH